jgi:hydrogenase expression/formation protein HypC
MERINPSTLEPPPAADSEHCITCADQAIPARVLQVLPDGTARVRIEGAISCINTSLVDAAPGDIVYVHADVAIAKLSQGAFDAEE